MPFNFYDTHAAVVHDNNRETVSIGTDAAVISD